MPLVSIARYVLKLERYGFTAREAALADSIWAMVAVLGFLGFMLWVA
jgi:hypothetical protein